MRSSLFSLVNVVRTALGLRGFSRLPGLDATAQAHAQYVAANGGGGSDESPALPCYTGLDFAQRLSGAGVFTVSTPGMRERSESVLAYFTPAGAELEPFDLINDWLHNVYGRALLLDPGAEQIGLGFSAQPNSRQRALVLDTALVRGMVGAGVDTYVVWPRNGAAGLPKAMPVSNLKPLEAGVVEGYPVTVHAGSAVQVNRFVLINTGDGNVVATTLVTAATDRNRLLSQGEAALVPRAPLAASTTYRVELEGMAGTQPLNLVWSFTTGS